MSINEGRHRFTQVDCDVCEAKEVDATDVVATAVYLEDARLRTDGGGLKIERRKSGIPAALQNHATNPVTSLALGEDRSLREWFNFARVEGYDDLTLSDLFDAELDSDPTLDEEIDAKVLVETTRASTAESGIDSRVQTLENGWAGLASDVEVSQAFQDAIAEVWPLHCALRALLK